MRACTSHRWFILKTVNAGFSTACMGAHLSVQRLQSLLGTVSSPAGPLAISPKITNAGASIEGASEDDEAGLGKEGTPTFWTRLCTRELVSG